MTQLCCCNQHKVCEKTVCELIRVLKVSTVTYECVFLSRRAVHQHIGVQLPGPGECGEWGFFRGFSQIPLFDLHTHILINQKDYLRKLSNRTKEEALFFFGSIFRLIEIFVHK